MTDWRPELYHDGGEDWSPAFKAMQREIDRYLGTDGNNIRRGVTIQLEARDYRLSRTLREERPNRWVGQGTTLAGLGGTRFVFADGAGIEIPGWRKRTTAIGHGSAWEHITIQGGYGVYSAGIFAMRDCSVVGSQQNGIMIDGHAGHANHFRLEHVFVQGSAKWGVYISGPDANAGLLSQVYTSQNKLGGIYNAAFLLTTEVACSAHESWGPSKEVTRKSGRVVSIGFYEEGGGPESQDNGLVDYYGGNARSTTTPRYAAGRYTGRHEFADGVHATGAVLTTDAGEFAIERDPVTDSLALKQSRVSPSGLRVTGPASHGYGKAGRQLEANRAWLESHYEGPVTHPIHVQYIRRGQKPEGGEDGDRAIVLDPKPGDTIQYVRAGGRWYAAGGLTKEVE